MAQAVAVAGPEEEPEAMGIRNNLGYISPALIIKNTQPRKGADL